MEIRAIEITDNSVGDAPILPEVLEKIPVTETISAVSGAYDTYGCHAVIAARGAAAVIPTRKNAQFWKGNTAGAKARN